MSHKRETALAGAALWKPNFDDHSSSERWLRASQRRPCPICGHASWCVTSPDGAVAGCMRIDRGAYRVANTRSGSMYLSRLRESDETSSSRLIGSSTGSPSSRRSAPIAPASIAHRDAAYSTLLHELILSPAHADYLCGAKRLSEEAVTRNLYATFPGVDTMTERCTGLAEEYDLAAVPGFYRDGRRWHFIGKAGELLIPIRDRSDQIAAILRRTGGQPKYRFASSSARGVSCGAPMHFALPYLAALYADDPIIVTEGVLKADAIAEHLHCAVIGVPGVGSLGGIDSQLLAWLVGHRVRIAYDADEQRNLHVRAALVRLVRMLESASASVDVLRWSEAAGKGLDDVLSGSKACR